MAKTKLVLTIIGVGFIVIGVVFNEWVLAGLFSPDGSIENLRLKLVIWFLNLFAVGWGITTLLFKNRDFVINGNLLVFTICLFSPLVGGEFLYEAAIYPEREYAFVHPLTREVAYRTQLASRRAELHGAAARALSADQPEEPGSHAALLAHHFDEAGEASKH